MFSAGLDSDGLAVGACSWFEYRSELGQFVEQVEVFAGLTFRETPDLGVVVKN